MYVVCSCVEFDCKNVLYKSNSYVSVTVSLQIKVLQLLLQVCRGVDMCISYEPHPQGESSPCGISSCLILYSISVPSDLAVR